MRVFPASRRPDWLGLIISLTQAQATPGSKPPPVGDRPIDASLFVFDAQALFVSFVCLTTAFVLGALIGLERQWRQRTAGLRTNVLVAVGAAAFVDLGLRTGGTDGGVRVISYIVSGIGFLGAGVIMKEGAQVRGLNTAATLWASAAVGSFAGGRRLAEAAW